MRHLDLVEDNRAQTGSTGEELAAELLIRPRTEIVLPYRRIVFLNAIHNHYPFFDLLAIVGDGPVCDPISVKSRQMYDANGHLKLAYRLETSSRAEQRSKSITCKDKLLGALERLERDFPQYRVGQGKFVAIQVDGAFISAYLGHIADTRHTECHFDIGLTEEEKKRYQCLAKHSPHNRFLPRNVYRKRS